MRVLLFQLPVPNNPATNVPLAAGYLKAYAHTQSLNTDPDYDPRIEIDILPRHIADHAGDAYLVEAIVAAAPDVLGMSLYTWNSQRSLAVAQRVKALLPQVIVVGGGPEVQPDNLWLLRHPGLDIGVIGEGEQTFVNLLRRLHATPDLRQLADVPGLVYEVGDQLVFTEPRRALDDLSVVPSPYLLSYLTIQPGDMALIEVSRWCPYACSFCLYGRNMGSKLGRRYFDLERVLTEIAWAKVQGATAIHFVEANLNLVPFFRPLMRALEDLNADRALALYAELRGEHLSEEVVAALDRAGLRVAEVGLQTANPAALAASQRKTDLRKWAEGTRRLLAHNVDVLLDVILGLPDDDADGIRTTLEFIDQEGLGAYDVFMLQVLPGTALRQQAETFGLVYQEQPPYYVLQTNRLRFADLRRLRRELHLDTDLVPTAVEGVPLPRRAALADPPAHTTASDSPIDHIVVSTPAVIPVQRLANHVDVIISDADVQACTSALQAALAANPSTVVDLYMLCAAVPDLAALKAWRESLAAQPGYLDFLTVYLSDEQTITHVSPRLWLVLPWTVQAEPSTIVPGIQIIWRYDLEPDDEPPLGAWRSAGGAGVWVPGARVDQATAWEAATGMLIWR